MERWGPYAAVASVTFALLVDEILLSAIFHVLIGGGNAVAAIAVALLGLSSSGVVAYLAEGLRRPERAAPRLPALLFGFGLSLLLCTWLLMSLPLQHTDLVFARPGDLRVALLQALAYGLATLPFFVGGLAVNVVLRTHAAAVSRLYFADLGGAAAGCLASPFLLSALGAPRGILFAAAPVLAMAVVLAPARSALRRGLVVAPALLLALAALQPEWLRFRRLNTMGDVRDPQHRAFPVAPGDIEFEKWALDAWTIVRGPRVPQQWEGFRGWGVSPRYEGPVPELVLVNYNARFTTYAVRFDGDFAPIADWLDADLISLHHLIGRSFDDVLVIGAGGGREVLGALHHGARSVTAIDVSEVVVDDLMKGRLREFSGGLYLDPRVRALAEEGRSFVERSGERWDLIDFSIVGGMNLEKMDLVRIDELFTREGLQSYLEHLTPEGVFSYVMYSLRADLVDERVARGFGPDPPYVPALHTLAGLRSVFEELWPDRRFADHVLIAALPRVIDASFDLVHIIASPAPFTAQERARFLERCEALAFQPVYPAAGSRRGLYADVVEATDLHAFAEALPFRIWPATDDRPFHYSFDASDLRRAFGAGVLRAFLTGNPVLALSVPIGVLALLLMLTPLLVFALHGEARPAGAKGTASLLLFFACIGFGYMAVEIAVLFKLQLYLGKPLYGLVVALFSFLLASALGSRFTQRFAAASLHRSASLAALLVLVVGFAYFLASARLFEATIARSLLERAAIGVAAVFPLAFVMGMFFPVGVKLAAATDEDVIPWAWAVNGCFSVLGIFGTRTVALFAGFGDALLVGLGAYGGVLLCLALHARARRNAGAAGAPALRETA